MNPESRPTHTASSPEGRSPKLLEQLRTALRARHRSYATEKSYVRWVRRYVLFHNKRHPQEMGESEINAFLSHLAVQGNVAASTQNQALNALIFFYRHVLKKDIGPLENLIRAKRPHPHGPGASRSQGRQDDADLHARPGHRCRRRA